MNFWKDLFAKRNNTESITDTSPVGDESELIASEKPSPAYEELLARACQTFATRDGILATMAAYKSGIPFDMKQPFNSKKDVTDSRLDSDISECSAALTNSIALAPFYADVFELGSNNQNLAMLVDNAIKNGVFENAEAPLPAAGEFSVAIIKELAEKENKSSYEIYTNLKENMFPGGKNEDSVAFAGLRVAGHYLAFPDVPYETLPDVCADLYSIEMHSALQCKKAHDFARQKYLDDPDDDWFLVPLAKDRQDIIDLVKAPVHAYTYELIVDCAPEAARWLRASNNVIFEEKYLVEEEEMYYFSYDSYHFSEFLNPLDAGLQPLSAGRISEKRNALENFQEDRKLFSEWYAKMQDKETAKANADELEQMNETLSHIMIDGRTFTKVNKALLANASDDLLKEYKVMKTLYMRVDQYNGRFTGANILADRFEAIKDDAKKLQELAEKERIEAEKRAAARQELLEAEEALRAVTVDLDEEVEIEDEDAPWSFESLDV